MQNDKDLNQDDDANERKLFVACLGFVARRGSQVSGSRVMRAARTDMSCMRRKVKEETQDGNERLDVATGSVPAMKS